MFNNKIIRIGISVMLWGYFAVSFNQQASFLGRLFHNIGNGVFPSGIAGVSGPNIAFILFTVVYAVLAYIVYFKADQNSEK